MKTTSEMKTNLKMKTTLKMMTPSKKKTTLEMKTISKTGPSIQFFLPPSPPLMKLPESFLMTSHCDSQTTTDIKSEMISGIKTGNRIYAALPMRTQREKTTFSCKDDCTFTKHTQRWTYSALWYF